MLRAMSSVRLLVCVFVTLVDCDRIVHPEVEIGTWQNRSKVVVLHFGGIQPLACRAISASFELSCYLSKKFKTANQFNCSHITHDIGLVRIANLMLDVGHCYSSLGCLSVCLFVCVLVTTVSPAKPSNRSGFWLLLWREKTTYYKGNIAGATWWIRLIDACMEAMWAVAEIALTTCCC